MGTIEEDRTRIQLHSNEVTVIIVSIRRELDEVRLQHVHLRRLLAYRSHEQLAQNQTIDTLRRQGESSKTSAQQAQV